MADPLDVGSQRRRRRVAHLNARTRFCARTSVGADQRLSRGAYTAFDSAGCASRPGRAVVGKPEAEPGSSASSRTLFFALARTVACADLLDDLAPGVRHQKGRARTCACAGSCGGADGCIYARPRRRRTADGAAFEPLGR